MALRHGKSRWNDLLHAAQAQGRASSSASSAACGAAGSSACGAGTGGIPGAGLWAAKGLVAAPALAAPNASAALERVLNSRGASVSGMVAQGVRGFLSGPTGGLLPHSRGSLLPSSARSLVPPVGNGVGTRWLGMHLPRGQAGKGVAAHRSLANTTRGAAARAFHTSLHPASAAIAAEAAPPLRALVRQYGPWGALLVSGVLSKLGWDYYSAYVEAHELQRPWRGNMVTIGADSETLDHEGPTTLLGHLLENLFCLARGLQLLVLFLPLAVTAPLAFKWDSSGVWRDRWGDLLLQTLMLAGPAFMKWGQWAAARPDLVPEDLCHKLETLHMDAPTHSYAYTQQLVQAAFGMSVNELFDTFDPKPLASGTIGQVYRGTLSAEGSARLAAMGQEPTPPGLPVAIKVRHPGVHDAIRYDFRVLKVLVAVVAQVPSLSWLHLDEMTWQFESLLSAQVDFTVEGKQLQHFNRNFRKWDYVTFPKPILAHPSVLVETFEEGVPLSQFTREYEEGSFMHRMLAKLGLSVVLKMMLVDNLVHADLHPGNILVRDLPSSAYPAWESFWRHVYQQLAGVTLFTPPQLVLVDAGMTTIMESEEAAHLVHFFTGVSKFDGDKMGKAMIDFSVNFPAELHESFQESLSTLMHQFKMDYEANMADSSHWCTFSDTLASAMSCVRDYRLCLQGHVCTIIVTSMMLSDLQQRLDPTAEVMKVLERILVGRTLFTFIPGLEDAVEWVFNKQSIMVPK